MQKKRRIISIYYFCLTNDPFALLVKYCPHVNTALESVWRMDGDIPNCCFDLKSLKAKWRGIMQFFIYILWVQGDKSSKIKFRRYKESRFYFKEINVKHRFTAATIDFRENSGWNDYFF